MLNFCDVRPNVQVNPLPEHGGPSMCMVKVYPKEYLIYDVSLVKNPLASVDAKLGKARLFEVYHTDCLVCERNLEGCGIIRRNMQGLMDRGVFQVSTKLKEDEIVVIVPQIDIPEPLEVTY